MADIGLEIVIVLLLILANGIFAMSELAVVTARKSRLQDWARKGSTRANAALELANAPNRVLSAVQVGITLIGILTGAFGGRTIADWLTRRLQSVAMLEPYSEAVGLALVVMAITYFSLVFGELVPKRFALRHPEGIATLVAIPLKIFAMISAPMVHLLTISTDAVFRLFGKQEVQEAPVTGDEINILVQQGTAAGVFKESEQDMVQAIFTLGDRSARSLMTPRTQIVWIDLNDPIEEIRRRIADSGHSRLPVARESLDQVSGIIQAKELLAEVLQEKPLNLESVLQQPFFVPRTVSALQVLESFKQSGKHIALVVDEYGGIEGLLTHHDILEAIAGEIPFSETAIERKAVQRDDGSWLLDGMLPIEDFKDIFNLESLPGENKDAFQTLGGFLFTQFGRVPSVADHFRWSDLRFEIVDMDGKRIDKVLVSVAGDGRDSDKPDSHV
jgi:putative hemolysin